MLHSQLEQTTISKPTFRSRSPTDSRPDAFELDPFLESDNPRFEALIGGFETSLRLTNSKKRQRGERKANFRVLMANLVVADERERGKPIKYYRRTKAYAGHSVYRPDYLSARLLKEHVDWLASHAMVSHQKGHKDVENDKSTMSLVCANDRLRQMFKEYGLSREMFTRSKERPVAILKSKKGKDGRRKRIEYGHNLEIQSMTDTLRSYNSFVDRFTIDLPPEVRQRARQQRVSVNPDIDDGQEEDAGGVIDLTATALHRVFNNVDLKKINLDQGGRFYGAWWQNRARVFRPFITIDGEQTVECDYGCFHPRMLYHLTGNTYDGDDLYQIPRLTELVGDFDPTKLRDSVKILTNVLINAKRWIINKRLKEPREELLERWKIELPEQIEVGDAFKLIEAYHRPIADHFRTGKGVYLQNLDSQICEYILVEGQEKGIPVLPIHDSFIVRQRDQEWLEKIMRAMYRQIIGPYDPVITVKPGVTPVPGTNTDQPRRLIPSTKMTYNGDIRVT